jgi:hypothetical protein
MFCKGRSLWLGMLLARGGSSCQRWRRRQIDCHVWAVVVVGNIVVCECYAGECAWRRRGAVGWQVCGSEDAVAFGQLGLIDGRRPQVGQVQGRRSGTPRLREALGGHLVAGRRRARRVFMAGGLRRI